MSKKIKRIDLLFREVSDAHAQENFYRLKTFLDNLAANGLADPPGPSAELAIGDNFEQFSDLTTFTTTAATDQVAASFTTTSKAIGLYRIAMWWDWTYDQTNDDAIFSLFVDGVLQDGEFRMELSETNTQNIPFFWATYINFASITTHTIELRARAETAGNTLTVNRVRAEIWRMN